MSTQTVTPEDTPPQLQDATPTATIASDNELDQKALMQLKIASFSIE